jgi:formate dehydrogenase maturation protein FdhE
MAEEKADQDHLQLLRDIRDGQQKIIELLAAQQALAEEQVKRSRDSIEESVSLQRLALQRQRTITLVVVPGILVCIAAIGYLVLRYL